jgi:hypothetical protein
MKVDEGQRPLSRATVNGGSRGAWRVVVLFSIAMGYLEAAVVLYLRTLGKRLDPYQTPALPPSVDFGWAEVIREVATIVMLASIGWLAGRNLRARFGYFLISFGVWDITYYVFLKPLTGWPRSLLDWDILFLIPLPWWGPVLAPVCIAALMILYGTLLSQRSEMLPRASIKVWLIALAGSCLALYVFMADAIRTLPQGVEALNNMLPAQFNWALFIVALLMMAAPVIAASRPMWTRQQPSSVAPTN